MNIFFAVFVEFDIWVLLGFIVYCYFYMFYMIILHAHAFCYDLCCVGHIMSMIKCLLDVFVCWFGLH